MGRIIFSGDIHGNIDIGKLNGQNIKKHLKSIDDETPLNKDDIIIIVGDFGLVWYDETHNKFKEDLYWRKWLINKGCTIAFVDGNHENHNLLDNLPIEEKFGGKVGIVNVFNEEKIVFNGTKTKIRKEIGQIYHLKRGEIYTINDKKIFTFGSAESQDKAQRIPNVEWWSREESSLEEQAYALENLEKHNWEIDYVLSHTCPGDIGVKIAEKYWFGPYSSNPKYNKFIDKACDSTSKFFNMLIANGLKFKEWHFGHYHEDIVVDKKFFGHYKEICIKY